MIFLSEFTLVILFLILLCLVTIKYFKRKSYKLPPLFPGALPIVGHSFIFMNCGKVPVNHDDCYILANKLLEKHDAYQFAKAWVGEGLITSSVPTWKRHRKLIMPAINQEILNGFIVVFNQQSRKLVNMMKEKVRTGPFNHFPLVRRITMESVCATIMGYSDNAKIVKMQLEYMEHIDLIFKSIIVRLLKLWPINEFLFKWSGLKKKQDEVIATLHKLTDQIRIEKELEMQIRRSENCSYTFKSFLELLLELKFKNLLTHQDVNDEMNTLIAAGYDTTAVSIGLAMLVLGSYPDIQNKVCQELQEIFGETDRDVTKEDLSQMTYLEAVIKETFRLYPIAPMVFRKIDKDFNIREYTLPAGDGIVILIYALNRHPAWGPDAEEFRPERWLDSGAIPKNAFTTFSIGRRNCIGMNYATMNLKTILCHVLRRYKITADVTKVEYENYVTANPVSGHHIILDKK